MNADQRAAALRLADRMFVFDDSREVARGVEPLHPYWGPEARDHIIGMWEDFREMAVLLRELAAAPTPK